MSTTHFDARESHFSANCQKPTNRNQDSKPQHEPRGFQKPSNYFGFVYLECCFMTEIAPAHTLFHFFVIAALENIQKYTMWSQIDLRLRWK